MDKELRYSKISNIETRNENDKMTITGYGITFEKRSNDLGGFIETIDKKALDSVDLSNVYFLRNHMEDQVLGNTKSGTLNLEVTETGLYFELDLPKTNRGQEIFALVKRGDLDSLSFGFTVAQDEWNMNVSPEVRNVTKIGRLFEISLVNFPAYSDSKISKRSQDFLNECRECKKDMNEENVFAIEARQILEQIKK